MPYPSSGTLTTDAREIAIDETWDSQTDWESYQSLNNVEIVNGVVMLEETEIPDTGNLQSHYVASEIDANDGDAISTWPDSAGSYDATGGSPIYRDNALNGEPVLEFDGSGDVLDTGYVQNTDDPRSIYAVITVNSTNAGAWSRFYGAYDSSGDGNRTYMAKSDGDEYAVLYGTGSNLTGSFVMDSWRVHSFVAGSGSAELFDNQTSVGTVTYSGNGSVGYSDAIGAYNDDGSFDSYTEFRIAELLRYNVDHESSTRMEVEAYLNNKYGVIS